MTYRTFMARRRARLLEIISDAARRSGRTADDITLAAVSKTVGPDEVADAWAVGYRVFAENHPQELTRKLAALDEHPEMAGARFDMIGNLQTNKINQVVGRVGLIQSVSSLHLAQAISKRSLTHGVTSRVLLEVNVSGEASKSGFSPDEARSQAEDVAALPGIEVRGLMTMAPAHDADAARRTFAGLRELACDLRRRTSLSLDVLSCGMSDDFPLAIEEGATLIRLGRVVFSPDYRL